MPLKTFAKKDEVPEALRDSAIETKDGKFVVSEDADTSKLEEAIESERTKREAAEKLSKKMQGDLKKLEAKLNGEGEVTEAQKKAIREELKAELDEEYAPIKKDAEKAKTLEAENRTLKLDNAVKGLMGKAGVRGERQDALWKLAGDRFDLTKDGKAVVKGKEATDIAKYLGDTLKQEFPEFYEGSKAGGGGGGGGGGKQDEPLTGNPVERLAAAHAAGKTE